ncbi:hypothetical protein DNTS_024831 [Danionella cerebrum]|uniref:Fibronectin type-III domain-containing protein n=3 Tax=Danionella cerebrum TaxID=2873325 RepID=A0A553QSI8_9TELE|nr:hypothetical protein DNTS_024831 [Danionella translucida]
MSSMMLKDVMLWVLLLQLLCSSVSAALQPSTRAAIAAAVTFTQKEDGKRPFFHRCRSPNMEIFTCWWKPLENQENISYTVSYAIGDSPPLPCPDYVSGGPHSCFFDAKHTQIWKVTCMNVTAHTPVGPITSKTYCLDVVEVVEPDPPFNLSVQVMNETACESGCSVLLSWMIPIAMEVREGWITLLYELRYRKLDQSWDWKVKERLREPHLELQNLRSGSYEFMVRCRSANNNLWSGWSQSETFTVKTSPTSDRFLAFILVFGVAIIAFIIIGCGLIPQGKRIKAFFLPPIPKPRIRGLEPTLLKKGKLEEIDRHFSSFHGYKPPPQSSQETCYQMSVDSSSSHEEAPFAPGDSGPSPYIGYSSSTPFTSSAPTSYQSSGSAPCTSTEIGPTSYSTTGNSPSPYLDGAPPAVSATPQLLSFPGMDYSVLLPSPNVNPMMDHPSTQEFYMCVNGMSMTGAPLLQPQICLKNSHFLSYSSAEEEKNSQLMALLKHSPYTHTSEAAAPLLQQTAD